MDLNENIRIAAEVSFNDYRYKNQIIEDCYKDAFETGALSQAAKEYWCNEFKQELKSLDNSQEDEQTLGSLRRIGIVGHGATVFGSSGPKVMICGGTGRSHGKLHMLEEMMLEAKEQGVIVVDVRHGKDLPEFLKGEQETLEFTRRPEIVMPAPNIEEFTITANNYECSFIPQEPKAWDRKKFPNKMNSYKSKKRNKR